MDYLYKGLELTPNIFAKLLIQFFDGKQFSRQDAVNTITNYHLENGGQLNKSSYVAVFKKAAQSLKDEGIENIGYGMWRLLHKEKEIIEILPKNANADDEINVTADKEIGHGSKAVYVYFYDSYKDLSVLKGQSAWQCKIGRTDVDPIGRIYSQAGTCYPELPHIALIIHCEDSSLLEKTIHYILKLRDRWLSDSPGKEWFFTSPHEIEEIYESIIGNPVF